MWHFISIFQVIDLHPFKSSWLNLTLFLLRFFLLLCSTFCILRPPTILILHKYLTIYILLFLLFTRWYVLDYFMQDEHSFFLGINTAKYHDMPPFLRSRKRSLVVLTSLVELLVQSNRGNRCYVKPWLECKDVINQTF